MTLRARTGSPPCRAASVTSAAGVSGRRSRLPSAVIDWPSRATADGYGNFERLHQALGEAARGAGGRRRRPALRRSAPRVRRAGRRRRATPSRSPRRRTRPDTDRATGTVRPPGRRCRRARRRWRRYAPRRRVPRRLRSRAAHRPGAPRWRSHRSARAHRPGGSSASSPPRPLRRGTALRPCGLAVAVGRKIRQRVGQPVVAQAVFGQSQGEIG